MVESGTAWMCLISFLQRLLQGETKIESAYFSDDDRLFQIQRDRQGSSI
jgi:hypothetical protein